MKRFFSLVVLIAVAAQAQSYRSKQDSPEWGQFYQQARQQYDGGQKKEALNAMANYTEKNPDGQFADEALYLLSKQALDENRVDDALVGFQKIIQMQPLSKLRGEAGYSAAVAQWSMGKTGDALTTLSQVNPKEIAPENRYRLYTFWGKTASQAGKSLEATLAYLKARGENPNADQLRDLDEAIESNIETRLSESDLRFLEKQYNTGFPLNTVHLRLASLLLAAGKRGEAEELLRGVLARTRAGSLYHEQAKRQLGLMQDLESGSNTSVGALLPLSGSQKGIGDSVVAGLETGLAAEGKKKGNVQLVVADAGPTPDSALEAFNRLVFEDNVMAVVGPFSGPQAEVVAQKASELGIPYITLSPRPGLLEKGPSVFRVALTPERQVRAVVGYAREQLNAKRFAILFPEDNFGEGFASEYFKVVEELGGEVTAAESYKPTQSDFRVQIQNMTGLAFPGYRDTEKQELLKLEETRLGHPLKPKEAEAVKLPPIVDFDVLFIPDTFKAVGQIVPALLFYDITTPQLMGPSTWNNPKLLERAGRYLENALFVDMYSPQRGSKSTKAFIDHFQSERGQLPGQLEAVGYDVGVALRMAFSSQPGSREELRSRLENLGSIEGAAGLYQWDTRREPLAELQFFKIKKSAFSHQGGILLKQRSRW